MVDKVLAMKLGVAADQLQISRASFYRLVAKREIQTIKIGGSRRVTPEALAAYVASKTSDTNA